MSIADAYVELHVDGDNLDAEVRSSVRKTAPGAERESSRVGQGAGTSMALGFLKGFGKVFSGGGGGQIGEKIKKSFKGLSPKGLLIPALAAALPFLTSSVSALSGALVAFTGAVAQASVSALALTGVLGTLIQTKLVMKLATNGLKEALKGEEGAMQKLAPAAQTLVKSLQSLNPQWTSLRKAVQQTTFAGVGGAIERLAKAGLPTLRRGLVGTGAELNTVFRSVLKFASSEGFIRRFGAAVQGNNAILRNLGKAAVPVLDGILRLFRALQPSSLRLSALIAKAGKSFQSWASAPGFAKRIDDMMRRSFASARNLWGILKNLGATLRNVFGAATPAGDGLLRTLNRITAGWAELSGSVSGRNAIAEWAETGIQVTGRLFTFIGKIGAALGPLFNPNIANGFLAVFESLMPVIQTVVGVIQTALAPVLERIGEAFAENGPKFAALFAALAPLLAGIGSVIGEIVGQALDMLGTIASVITPVVGVISGVLGPALTRFAPIIAAIILAFTTWGGAIVKVIPVIGRLLRPIVEIATVLFQRLGPALGFIGRLVGKTFGAIGRFFAGFGKTVTGPFRAHWNGIVLTVRLAMQIVRSVIGKVWGVVKTIFSTALRVIGTVVRTYFNIYRTIIVTVFNVIKTVISVAWRAISTVIRVAVKVIGTVVRGGFNLVKSIITTVFNAIKSVVVRVWEQIATSSRNGAEAVVTFIKSIPGKILGAVSAFLNAGKELGSSVISGLMDGLRAAGGFVTDIGAAVKSSINGALGLPVTINGPGPLPDFTIPAFARGGVAPGGMALVGERGPELVNLPRGSKVHSNEESRRMVGNQKPWPSKMTLRIGAREFVAYVEEIADDRIDAADSLSWQGA